MKNMYTIFLKKINISHVLIVIIGLLTLPSAVAASTTKAKIKVACIGDSVTEGMALPNPETQSYPAQLQLLLKDQYEVKNFGKSGTTLLKKGSNPYYKTAEYQKALAFRPDIAIIHLGLNDTDPRNWPNYREDFIADYTWLIEQLRLQNPKVQIYICKNTPIYSQHPRFKAGTRTWFWQIQQEIENVASNNKIEIIDLHEPLYKHPELFPDALHPEAEGTIIMAKTVYGRLSHNYGALELAPIFSHNMVLQREAPIVIYGKANGNQKIKIKFGKQSSTVQVDKSGKWRATLEAQTAGGPFELVVTDEQKTIALQNILVGDVWFCSGQSNMALTLQQSYKGDEIISNMLANPNLRLFNYKPIAETDNASWDSTTLAKVNQLKYFEGHWQVSNSVNAKDFSAIAYYFGDKINQEMNVPIGIIQVAVGGSGIESWIDRYTLEQDNATVDMLTNWRKSEFIMPWVRSRADVNLANSTQPKQRHPYEPTYNYDAGIAPFTNFSIKGFLWYQGESNAHNIELYEHLMPAMVKSWREKWHADYPFYYVQLSSIDRPSWPYFREAQNKLQKVIPNSKMAISYDYGDSLDVHPKHKKEIAERLVLLALKNSYNKCISAEGPEAKMTFIEKNKIIVKFDHAQTVAAATGSEIKGFELVTDKGIRLKANVNSNGNTVEIPLPKDHKISKILYAYEAFTRANLVNEAGLPCSTFQLEL